MMTETNQQYRNMLQAGPPHGHGPATIQGGNPWLAAASSYGVHGGPGTGGASGAEQTALLAGFGPTAMLSPAAVANRQFPQFIPGAFQFLPQPYATAMPLPTVIGNGTAGGHVAPYRTYDSLKHFGSLPQTQGNRRNKIPTTSKTNLYISGLSESDTDESVRALVEGIVRPKSCKAMIANGKCKGSGFIDCASEDDAEKAMNHIVESTKTSGRKLAVKYAYENEKDMLNVYVRNLPRTNFNKEQLEDLFKEFGQVTSVKLLETDGIYTGTGFVRFAKPEQAQSTVEHMNERKVVMRDNEKPVTCKLADKTDPRRRVGGGGSTVGGLTSGVVNSNSGVAMSGPGQGQSQVLPQSRPSPSHHLLTAAAMENGTVTLINGSTMQHYHHSQQGPQVTHQHLHQLSNGGGGGGPQTGSTGPGGTGGMPGPHSVLTVGTTPNPAGIGNNGVAHHQSGPPPLTMATPPGHQHHPGGYYAAHQLTAPGPTANQSNQYSLLLADFQSMTMNGSAGVGGGGPPGNQGVGTTNHQAAAAAAAAAAAFSPVPQTHSPYQTAGYPAQAAATYYNPGYGRHPGPSASQLEMHLAQQVGAGGPPGGAVGMASPPAAPPAGYHQVAAYHTHAPQLVYHPNYQSQLVMHVAMQQQAAAAAAAAAAAYILPAPTGHPPPPVTLSTLVASHAQPPLLRQHSEPTPPTSTAGINNPPTSSTPGGNQQMSLNADAAQFVPQNLRS